MSERSEIDTASSGADGRREPAFDLWWFLLAMAAGTAGFGLLSKLLVPTLELTEGLYGPMVLVALLTTVFAAALGRPATFGQAAIVAATSAAAGVFAMLVMLPVTLFSQGLEVSSQRSVVHMLGILHAGGFGSFGAVVIYRQLGVPWGSTIPAKDRP